MKKLCILLLLLLIPATAFAYTDVPTEGELGEAVYALSEKGVINGYSDGTFRPDKPITRGELCKMINVLFNFTDVGKNDFSDIKYDDWFYTNVLIANEYGYIKGYTDGTFKGNNNVTREQASVIVDRITPLLEVDNHTQINDEVSDWARDSVQMIANHKLLKTDENGNFRAKENITRGELAMLLKPFIPVERNDMSESEQGTNAEIAIANAVVYANLRAAIRDIESIEFNENEKPLINDVLTGLKGTVEAGLNGHLINKNYVVTHYAAEINRARAAYKSMTEDEKGYFHTNIVKLNNSTLMFLQTYFLGDKPVLGSD